MTKQVYNRIKEKYSANRNSKLRLATLQLNLISFKMKVQEQKSNKKLTETQEPYHAMISQVQNESLFKKKYQNV